MTDQRLMESISEVLFPPFPHCNVDDCSGGRLLLAFNIAMGGMGGIYFFHRHGLCRRLCIRAPAHVSFVSFTFLSPLRDGTSEILSIHVSPQGSRSPLKYVLHSVKLKVKLKDKGQGPPMNTNSRAKYRSEFVDFQKLSNTNNFVYVQSTASN